MSKTRLTIALLTLALLMAGCVSAPALPPTEPVVVSAPSFEAVWNATVFALDEYFDIASEDRTTGRIETRPLVAATLLEPWRRDSTTLYQRLEATLQSERRRAFATVRELAPGQYQVSVEVYRELEDLPLPVRSPTGHALFRSEPTLHREYAVVTGEPTSRNWINLGRDAELEARILADIQGRVGYTISQR